MVDVPYKVFFLISPGATMTHTAYITNIQASIIHCIQFHLLINPHAFWLIQK